MTGELRKVDCRGEILEYTLLRKKVKNINMRVKGDGSVTVSSASGVSVKFLDDFVSSKYEYIKESVERLSAVREDRVLTFEEGKNYVCGDQISFLGEKLTIAVQTGDDKVFVSGSELVVQTLDVENLAFISKLIRNFLYNSTVALFSELNDSVSAAFTERYGIPKVPIKLRRMKSRWGSCHVTDGFIVMNTNLIHYPKKCAEAIFVHEYSHFIEPNHSASFYAVMASVMPDFKTCTEQLKRLT